MRLKDIAFLLLFVLWALGLEAQGEAPVEVPHLIEFEELTHDFGSLEQGAPTETVFKFKNTSKQPVTLANVKAACGCTTPDWPKGEIAPGATGQIKVSYNSQRVGFFNKSVAVIYNDRTDPITLFIKGTVNAKEGATSGETNVAPPAPTPKQAPVQPPVNYSVIRGALAFENVILNAKNFTSEEDIEVEFKFKNVSSLPVHILRDKTQADAEVSLVFKTDVLQPGQEGSLKAKVNGQKLKESGQVDGYMVEDFAFFTDEAQLNKKELTITGNFKRVFSEAERNNSPHIVFEVTNVDGAKVIEGEKYVYDFKFKNTGPAPLKILSAKPGCGCTVISPVADETPSGGEGAITATFDSRGRTGMQSKTITVTTNDIENPVIGLRFTVEVIKDPFHAGGVVDQQ